MATASVVRLTVLERRSVFRWSRRDAWLVGAALGQAGITALALALLPARGLAAALAAAIWFGLSIWWGSNTVSHNHLHNPLFHSRLLNRSLALYLSVLYAVPQSIWRERHLWHHAGERARRRPGLPRDAGAELSCIAIVWGALGLASPRVLVTAAVGYALGMALCRLQGDMEHALSERPERGISHYGRLHNLLWFNDGHHAEHHRWPGLHWTRLPERRARLVTVESRFVPALRWLEPLAARLNRAQGTLLGWLERLPFALRSVRRFMIETHLRAFRCVLSRLPAEPQTVGIIGGGLFPRTLLVLRELLPAARLTVIDCSAENVARAREFLVQSGFRLEHVEFRIERFEPSLHGGFDLLVVPLGFVGDRRATLTSSGFVLSHDWVWQRAGKTGAVVSWLLLKRLNLHAPLTAVRAAPIPLPEAA